MNAIKHFGGIPEEQLLKNIPDDPSNIDPHFDRLTMDIPNPEVLPTDKIPGEVPFIKRDSNRELLMRQKPVDITPNEALTIIAEAKQNEMNAVTKHNNYLLTNRNPNDVQYAIDAINNNVEDIHQINGLELNIKNIPEFHDIELRPILHTLSAEQLAVLPAERILRIIYSNQSDGDKNETGEIMEYNPDSLFATLAPRISDEQLHTIIQDLGPEQLSNIPPQRILDILNLETHSNNEEQPMSFANIFHLMPDANIRPIIAQMSPDQLSAIPTKRLIQIIDQPGDEGKKLMAEIVPKLNAQAVLAVKDDDFLKLVPYLTDAQKSEAHILLGEIEPPYIKMAKKKWDEMRYQGIKFIEDEIQDLRKSVQAIENETIIEMSNDDLRLIMYIMSPEQVNLLPVSRIREILTLPLDDEENPISPDDEAYFDAKLYWDAVVPNLSNQSLESATAEDIGHLSPSLSVEQLLILKPEQLTIDNIRERVSNSFDPNAIEYVKAMSPEVFEHMLVDGIINRDLCLFWNVTREISPKTRTHILNQLVENRIPIYASQLENMNFIDIIPYLPKIDPGSIYVHNGNTKLGRHAQSLDIVEMHKNYPDLYLFAQKRDYLTPTQIMGQLRIDDFLFTDLTHVEISRVINDGKEVTPLIDHIGEIPPAYISLNVENMEKLLRRIDVNDQNTISKLTTSQISRLIGGHIPTALISSIPIDRLSEIRDKGAILNPININLWKNAFTWEQLASFVNRGIIEWKEVKYIPSGQSPLQAEWVNTIEIDQLNTKNIPKLEIPNVIIAINRIAVELTVERQNEIFRDIIQIGQISKTNIAALYTDLHNNFKVFFKDYFEL